MEFRSTTVLMLVVMSLSAIASNEFVHASRLHRRFDVPAVFAFGDSLADAGNNNYLPLAPKADFPPYGKTFFKKPTGRFTNGRNSIDFVAHALGLPFVPPFLQPQISFTKGVNFASAGSGLLDSTSAGRVNPMSLQLQQFASVKASLQQQLGAQKAETLIAKSFFMILSGSNDISAFLGSPEQQKQMNATQFIATTIAAYQETLITLYNSGARKVVVFNLGPIGCAPLSRAANPTHPGECIEGANQLALGFNSGLKQLVDGLRIAYPGFNLVMANTFNITTAMIADGASFGFENVKSACCGAGFLNAQVQCGLPVPANLTGAVADFCERPSKALFWDILHPSEVTVRIIFNLAFHGDSVGYPINLKTLADL